MQPISRVNQLSLTLAQQVVRRLKVSHRRHHVVSEVRHAR